ncbi:hypothetical protein YC2023_047124 [Brassica napus]|uniref:(rape) hypothetical protein n=1 Tax=Brassica napus TaxID=3708 RepID=A0A817B2J9_BRANA|nr:unnamed protein product [Brassica napus]
MVAQGFTVDLNKPLVFQVGHLGEEYEEWVHQPIVSKEGPRFFKSDFWEFLTLTRWWVVPVIWLPVSLWCISMSVRMGLSLAEIVPLIALGIFIWTFIEYTLHRFLFHIKTKSYWGNTAHYLLHGCHHKHPMDHLRLVFPPTATLILCFPFWNIVKLFTTPSVTPVLFGGGMLGYVMYDVTHYYLHHAQPTKAVTKNLKKYHLNHHFRIQDKGFVDRVGYIREASFEILHKHYREKTSVPMTILHVFTHIAKEKMMSSSDHDISNAVLKSIVMFLEEKHFGTVEGNAKLHPGKNQCHFSDRSFSLENIALMLMESVQEFTQSNTLHQSLTEFRPEYKNFQLVWARDQSVPLCDILSLVELIGCYTDWTSENIVALLLKMLGMPLSVNFAVSVVSLLGQLSSIGVDADGCENEGISNLREKLSAFLQCETILKAGFAVQIATVCSLLKTLQLDFSTVFRLKTAMLPGCGDQSLSASANLVTKWFSLLSDEQRVFTAEFLQLPVVK